MCYLCLQDFDFQLPVKPELEQKKKRLLQVKKLLKLAAFMEAFDDVCDSKVEALKEEQYTLSREF